jgi:flagellar M-ring protein FliF
LNYFYTIFQNLNKGQLISIVLSVLSVVGFFIYLILRVTEPDMRILFSQLDPSDSPKIIDKLKTLSIPYELKNDGEQIFIASDKIALARMELAQDGIPSGGVVGYEIFDKNDIFGATSSLMDIHYLRALEGELSKSIRTIQGVLSARVHLVIPKKEVFSQEKDAEKETEEVSRHFIHGGIQDSSLD